MLSDLFSGPVNWGSVVLALATTVVIAYVLAELAARVVRTTLFSLFQGGRVEPSTSSGQGPTTGAREPRVLATVAGRPAQIVRAIVFLLMAAVLFRPALNVAGLSPSVGVDSRALSSWIFDSGLRIGVIMVFTYVLVRAIAAMTGRFERRLRLEAGDGIDALEHVKRARTLAALVQRVVTVVVVSIAALTILGELRIDITPILTGAGIVGLAVGFGAQTLVRDIISGFFVILENQVRVGDVAVINGTGGLVEAINLRTIVLRDFEGVVHIFPNGSVTTLANRTKDYSYAVVDVGAAYREDPDAVIAVLKEIGKDLVADPAFRGSILEPLEVVGVEALGDLQVLIRTRIKTVPLKQWEVARELRKRIKKTFDMRGIRLGGTPVLLDAGMLKPPPPG
jgi:small conductance mechanosensitive channel